MSVVIPHKFVESISKAKDPRQSIFDFVGDMSGLEIIGDRVLVAIYMRPEKTQGGIIRPDTNKLEDVYQGKVGLVLKWGPDAFRNEETGEYYEQTVKPGEWGVFFVGDGKAIEVNKAPCRLVKSANFVMKIRNPDAVL